MSEKNLLKELFEKDYVTREVKLTPEYPSIILQTVTFNKQAGIEQILKEESENLSNRQFVQLATITVLSHSILSWGDKFFQSPEECSKFLSSKPLAVIQKLAEEQQDLEEELKKALSIKGAIDREFFEGEGKPGESKP